MIDYINGRIDVFINEIGVSFFEQIENENWLGQMDLIMNENLRMVAYGENERKFCQIEKVTCEIGKIVKQIENENWLGQMDLIMNESLKIENHTECELLRWKTDIIMNENLVIEKELEDLKNKFWLHDELLNENLEIIEVMVLIEFEK